MLWFWVIVLVALIGAIAVVAAGRGDSMAEVYDDRPDATLPAGRALTADDLRSVRLNTGVRGYRMDEVDALLSRLEAEMIEREDRDVRLVPRVDDDLAGGPATTEPEIEIEIAIDDDLEPDDKPAIEPEPQPEPWPDESHAAPSQDAAGRDEDECRADP
ncbi:MAG: DivIVA domain-containing protein [Nocardioidaceae bacterium]